MSEASPSRQANPLSEASEDTATAAVRRALQSSPQPRAVAGEPRNASLRCIHTRIIGPYLSISAKSSIRVIHLRTQCASEALLTGVNRAGEGIMVSPAHPGGLRGASERDLLLR